MAADLAIPRENATGPVALTLTCIVLEAAEAEELYMDLGSAAWTHCGVT